MRSSYLKGVTLKHFISSPNFDSQRTEDVTSFLKFAATKKIRCVLSPIFNSISSTSSASKKLMMASTAFCLLPRYLANTSIISCFDRVEQYDAYFIACHVTSLPESSSLFSITTNRPCLSRARRSSLSLVSAKPSNSFWITRSSSPRTEGSAAIHSCKCFRSVSFRSEKLHLIAEESLLLFSSIYISIFCQYVNVLPPINSRRIDVGGIVSGAIGLKLSRKRSRRRASSYSGTVSGTSCNSRSA